MAERKESVRVSASGGDFSREFNKLAAEAVLLREAIKSVPNHVTVRAQSTGFDKVEREARAAERSSSLLADAVATIWPALIPVGALAVPAVAGLAAQFGFAAAGAGAAILAFHGVADGLKALDQYQLHPTAANLQKLNDQMSKLGPAGQDFVHELDRIEPKLKSLKVAAENGILPGATDGIEHLLTLLPQVRRIIGTISGTTGDLLSEAGKNLAGPEFRDFFTYLETNARPILEDLGHTLGNLVEGMAHLFTGFAPSERDFSGFLLKTAQGFNDWADGLSKTQGFADFLDYLKTSGPQVGDALGSIASALVSVVKAGAPLSGPTLHLLGTLADIIDKIASSPVGTPLVALASGMALFNRSLAVKGSFAGSPLANFMRGDTSGLDKSRGALKKLTSGTVELRLAQEAQAKAALRARDSQSALIPTPAKRAALSEYVASSKRVAAAEKARAESYRRTAAGIAKGGALLAGLALASSDLGDKFGFANTASLALTGTIAGPWGAAIGGAIGLAKDLAAANDDLEAAVRRADAAMASGDQNALNQSARGLQKIIDLKKKAQGSGTHAASRGLIGQLLDQHDIDKANSALLKVQGRIESTAGIGTLLTQGIGGPVADLARQFDGAKTAAQQFFDGLDAATGRLDLRAALRAQAQAIIDFRKTLKDNPVHTGPQAALNRNAALDTFARDSIATANLTKSPVLQTRRIAAARTEFLKLADSMKMPADRARALADSFGLIDRTGLGAKNAPKARKDLDGVTKSAGRARDEVVDLGKKHAKPKADLNHAKFDTDNAFVRNALGALNKQHARPSVSVNDQASGPLSVIQARLNSLHSKSITIRAQEGHAAGGRITGPGGPRDDLIPAMLSNGEYVVNARAYSKYARQIEWINAQGLANGGRVTSPAPSVSVGAPSVAVGGAQIRVFVDGREVRAVVDEGFADHGEMTAAKRRDGYRNP